MVLTIKDDGRFKARWVACGYSQRYGIDYDETFSPTVQFKALLTLLHMAGVYDYDICTADIGNAFLETDLDFPVRMAPPKDLARMLGWNDVVLAILGGLYGLKQAGKLWYELLKKILISAGFKISTHDPCVFFFESGVSAIWIAIHVDDILIISTNKEIKLWFIDVLESHLRKVVINEEREIYYLGMKITRDRANRKVHINQHRYIDEVLSKSLINEGSTVSPYPIDIVEIEKSPLVTSKAATADKLYGKIINPEIVTRDTKKDDVEGENEYDENDRTGDETLTSRIINTGSRNRGSSSRRADVDHRHDSSVNRRVDEHHGVDNTQDVINLRGNTSTSLEMLSVYDDQGSISDASIDHEGLDCLEDDLEMTPVYDYFNAIDLDDDRSKGVGVLNSGNRDDNRYLPIYEQIGSLRYLADRSRPDILYAVNYLSRFMLNPNEHVLVELHRLLKYINKTKHYELIVGGYDIELFAMADSSFVSTGDCRSQMGFAIFLGSGSGSVCSFSKRATTVALSTTHAETDSLTECVKEVLWFQGFLRSINIICNEPTMIWIDNDQLKMNATTTSSKQNKSKYYLIKISWLQESVLEQLIDLRYIPTQFNFSDIFTKGLNGKLLLRHSRGVLGDRRIMDDDDYYPKEEDNFPEGMAD
jgi:hypothetical protein